jgi:hypothetical protein
MNYYCGENSYVQVPFDQVFEGIANFKTNLNFQPKTKPKEIDATSIENKDLGQFLLYNRKYNQKFIFSDNKNEYVILSTNYNRVMDLWAINEDGTTVLIRDGLFIDVSSTIYALKTSAPIFF